MKPRIAVPGLVALVSVGFWMLIERPSLSVPLPFEDAAMLFRYAENLVSGGGISWNNGADPSLSDGATDLGFVLALSPLLALGLSSALAAMLLNLSAVLGSGLLLGLLGARVWRAPVWVPVALAAVLFSGPVNRFVLSGFSAPVMGFLLLLTFTATALSSIGSSRSSSEERRWLVLAGSSAAAVGWWRPEGFLFGALAVLAGLVVSSGGLERTRRWSRLSWLALVLPYLALALAWVLFRVAYFGQILPTSAVMKTGSINLANFTFSVQFYAALLLPVVAVAFAQLVGPIRFRFLVAGGLSLGTLVWLGAAIPAFWWSRVGLDGVPDLVNSATYLVLLPLMLATAVVRSRTRWLDAVFPTMLLLVSVIWVFIETTLNWWGRMQWPLTPLLAAASVSSFFLWNAESDLNERIEERQISLSLNSKTVLIALALVGTLPFHLPRGGYSETPFHTTIARSLETVDTRGVRLATTEAGLIPLAISGVALDAYGHNDREIAETGGESLQRQLEDFKPNVIVVHGPPPALDFAGSCTAPNILAGGGVFPSDWIVMTTKLYEYALTNGMEPAVLVETDPCDTWSVWLGPTIPSEVKTVIREQTFEAVDLLDTQ